MSFRLRFRPTANPDPELPTVTLEGTDLSGTEGLDTITLTLTRTGPTTSALTVFLLLGGSADSGDYSASPLLSGGSVDILAGQASRVITITPADDATYEGTRTLTVAIDDHATYNVGEPFEQTASIIDDDAPEGSSDHPRILTTSSGVTALRSQLASDSAFAARWQTAIDQFESAGSTWNKDVTNAQGGPDVNRDPYACAFAAFLIMVRRSDDDLGLTWSQSWQFYRDRIMAAAYAWLRQGRHEDKSIATAIIYDCLYNDLTAQEKIDFEAWIETSYAANGWMSNGVEVYDNGSSDDNTAKLFSALASPFVADRISTAYDKTVTDVAGTNDWMGFGFGLGREWHEGYTSRHGLPMALLAIKYSGGYTDADTIDKFLTHLRDTVWLSRDATIPHPAVGEAVNGASWTNDKFHTQDPIKAFHVGKNVACHLLWALTILPGKVNLDGAGQSDQATLANDEDDFLGYLGGLLSTPLPTSGTALLDDITDVTLLGVDEYTSQFYAFPAWLIYNVQIPTAVTRTDAGLPLVRRFWPGTLEWTFILSPDFTHNAGSVIRYTHRRYGVSNYEQGCRQNGRWHVHRDGPLLVSRSVTGHSYVGRSATWAANGCVTFVDSTLYPAFTFNAQDGGDNGGIRDTASGNTKAAILALGDGADHGTVDKWHADEKCVAISSDLTMSYNSSLVQYGPNGSGQNEPKISNFTREFVTIRRNGDGTDREKVFTYDRITLLDTRWAPRYHLCPATDPDIDGTEAAITPWGPVEADPENWYATGPTQWEYTDATRMIYDNATEPAVALPGDGKVCVTWLQPASPVVRKTSGENCVSQVSPGDNGTPFITDFGGWQHDDDWSKFNNTAERAYTGTHGVYVTPSTVSLDTNFLMACEVMAVADTPGAAAGLLSDGASVAARCGASAVVFSKDGDASTTGMVDIPSGVVLVVLTGLTPSAVYTLTPEAGLTITSGERTASSTGVLPVDVTGAGELTWSEGASGGNSLTHSMGIGGVTDSAAVWRARTDTTAQLAIRYSTNSDLSGSTTSAAVTTDAADDFTGGDTISGLNPNTTYYYGHVVDGVLQQSAPFPSFKTFPTEDVDATVKIVVASCQDRERDAVTGCWIPAAAEAPNLQLHLGDFVYGDYNTLATLRPAYQDEYTGDQQTYITNVMARAQTRDDHDAGGNNSDSGTTGIDLTRQVWREYVPSYPLWDEDLHIGYEFKLANCHFFVLDTREQRESSRVRYPATGSGTYVAAQSGSSGTTVVLPSDASSFNGAYPGDYLVAITSSGTYYRRVVSYVGSTRTATVDRSIPDLASGDDIAIKQASMLDKGNLGATGQLERLINGLLTSTSRWKFFCTSVLWNREDTGGTTNDIWCGWDPEQFERNYILQRLEDGGGAKNVIVLSGDRHFSAIDDGTNSDFPELTSSAFHRQTLTAICPWSEGSYAVNPSYGVVEVDGTAHTVTLSVKTNVGADAFTPLVINYEA